MPEIVLIVLKALAVPAVVALGGFLAAHLPAIHAKTKNQQLNEALDTLGTAAEDVVKSALQGQLLAQLCQALLTGQPLAGPLVAALPGLQQQVLNQMGPAVQKALQELLGGQAAADKKVQSALLAAAHDHVAETLKVIRPLPSGQGSVVSVAGG